MIWKSKRESFIALCVPLINGTSWFRIKIINSQLCDRADLDTSFVSFEKRLPQPEIKGMRR